MCLPNNNNKNQQNGHGKANRSPWGRIKQQLKPRLSRKIVPSSKINLNHFWDDFSSAEKTATPIVEFAEHCSEIHDNIINELLEL